MISLIAEKLNPPIGIVSDLEHLLGIVEHVITNQAGPVWLKLIPGKVYYRGAHSNPRASGGTHPMPIWRSK
tara:strand:- start:394 stop:606 length:213 start_codon:yes stop_codon:yes gene_type:complete